ncbi:MAG: phosphoribosylglycinamide formyltransferase, partial [Actinomycetota bacterium]|nr:phosphoribosylglycinamide formyltransferase [Actinomycetota bacterium]
ALQRARDAGVPTAAFPRAEHVDRDARDQAMAAWLTHHDVQLVVLAGYMALLTPAFVRRFAGAIINVHPSLLPAFPGVRAIDQALDYGVKVFGVTVHFVDEGTDTGPVILQRAVELDDARDPADVLERLRPLEHALLPEAVRLIARRAVRPDPLNPRRTLIQDP